MLTLSAPTATTRLTFMGDGTRDDDTAGPDAEPALSVRGLTKTYRGGFTAIEGLYLDIPDGAFFGLLGPNGAGKTTLIGAVCNLLRPTAGEIQVFGHHHESREARRLVGLAEQDINLDRFLNIGEILVYHAGYDGIGRREAWRRARELLDLFKLGDKTKSRHTELSGGMQRRLLLARVLMHRPRLIILDEPTAGVDVELRAEIWRYTRLLNETRRDHPADHPLPGGSRGALPGDRAAACRADHRTRQPGGSPPPVRGRRPRWGLRAGDGGRGGGATVSGTAMALPASGTAQLLAPLPSSRTYRAERPAFVWLTEREVLRFLKIWYFTIAGHIVSALLFVVVFGFALDRSRQRRAGDSLCSVHLARPGCAGDAQRRLHQRHHQPVRGPPLPVCE